MDGEIQVDSPSLPPLSPIERRDFDYTTLEEAMAHLDGVVRHARRALNSLAALRPPEELVSPDITYREGASCP
ncbi:MAG TPA: hypothetical protein VKG63_05535 [Steroidobacteraceae bacterium]|nr:hypothetical protein [Steroidobacteraceae bacterium]